MSNSYSWNENLQLEQEFDYTSPPEHGHSQRSSQFGEEYRLPNGYSQPLPYYPTQTEQSLPMSYNNTYAADQQHSALYDSSANTTQQSLVPTTYDFQPSLSGSLTNGFPNSASHASSVTYMSASPGPIHQSFPTLPPAPPSLPAVASRSTSRAPGAKRQRPSEPEDKQGGEDADKKTDGKPKPLGGACARCKHLKVRCEFKTDTDPCRRCFNGGHECAPPGQKKRRTPPKREHLLGQIREQAAQIQDLMAQLEAMNKKVKNQPSTTFSQQDLHSPVLSPTSTDSHGSFLISQLPSTPPVHGSSMNNKAVDDWLSKARESLAQFGGLIGAAGGMPKSYFVDEESEDGDDTDEDDLYYGEGEGEDWEEARRAGETGEYGFAVADSDGEDIIPKAHARGESKPGSRSSSFIASSAAGMNPKKKDSAESKLATLPGEDSPFGLMADLSLKRIRQRGNSSDTPPVSESHKEKLGVASENFFRISPAPESATERSLSVTQEAPHILARGIITPAEAESLFELYYDRMNISASLLDPVLYTAEKTCVRSPFLFTVVCAIASRFYTPRPELYPQIMHYAQLAAGSALIGGQKCVEMCQGYILLSLFPVPARRWEDDRSWLYVGLAIRVAMDLNLHLPSTATPKNEAHAREILNRTRLWLNCFNLDRSTSSSYGKFPVIKNTDYLATHSHDWWRSSPYNMENFDIHICAYTAELIRMADFRQTIHSDPNHPTGLNKSINHAHVATQTDDDLCHLQSIWFEVLDKNGPPNFRTSLLKLAYAYSRLIALSTGFQSATFGKADNDTNPFLDRCLRAATDIVNAVLTVDSSYLVYLQHGPVAQTVFVVFSASFLVKLLQPKYTPYLSREKRVDIRNLVERVVELLMQVGLDDTHAPRLYARFLQGLLATPMASVDHPSPTGQKGQLPRQRRSRRTKPSTDRTFSADSPSQLDLNNNHASPASSSSLSPPPTGYSYFDDVSMGAGQPNAMPDDSLMSSAFFQPPLGLDPQIIESMQSFTDPELWHNISSTPAMSWMNQYQSDIQMRPSESYQPQQYFHG